MQKTTIDDCKLIQLPKISERKGALTPIYSGEHVPFEVQRVFYIYDVPGGEGRGAHAHKKLYQFLVSVMGAFDVVLDDGSNTRRVRLDRAYYGLLIPPMIWLTKRTSLLEESVSSWLLCLTMSLIIFVTMKPF